MISKITLIAFLSLIMSNAFGYVFVSQNQAYVGFSGGYGGMLTYQPSVIPTSAGNSTNYTGVNLRKGVSYRVQTGYLGYPRNTYDIDSVTPSLVYKGHTSDLLVVLRHNYNDGWNIAAKIGAAYVTQKLENPQATDIQVNNQSVFGTRTEILPEAALVFGYNVTEHFGLELSAQYVFAGSSGQNKAIASSAADVNKVASVVAGLFGVYFEF
jgi:hypothetical protein